MSELHTAVTKIGKKYHCRLFNKGKVVDEMACKNKCDISFCCATMLRWFDKLGGVNDMASASRLRQKNTNPVGKIWYRKDLEN